MFQNKPFTKFAGTPTYYPPEWYINHQYEGKQLDTWALGVLLYTMVEGCLPFPEKEDIVGGKFTYKVLDNVSSALCRDLISSILQKDTSKRLLLDEIMRHPWLVNES